MAEIEYNQLPTTSLEEGDNGRLQRRVGGLWKDYQFDILGNGGFFRQEYDVADLFANPVQNLGPAAPAGKGYVVLPTSWVSYDPFPGHVDFGGTLHIYDAAGSDIVEAVGMLWRAGDTVYAPLNCENPSWEQIANSYQLILDASAVPNGQGLVTFHINYFLRDI